MVFDMGYFSLARSAIPAKGAGGSPNGIGGERRRHPVAAADAVGEVGQIRPEGSAGDKAHGVRTVLGPDAVWGVPDPVVEQAGWKPGRFSDQ